MKINGFTLFLIAFLATMVIATVFYPLRYLKYLLPLIPLPFYIRNRHAAIDKSVFYYYYTFIIFYSLVILYLLFQNIFFTEISDRFLANAIFILAPLLFLTFALPYFQSDKVHNYVRLIFVVNMLLFFYEQGADLFSVLTNLHTLKTAIITSEFPTESNLAYVFGFLLIYFYVEKYPFRYQLVNFIFFVLCFKRIVIAASLSACIVHFLIGLFHVNIVRFRKTLTFLGIVINVLFIKFTQLIVSGEFDKVVFEKTGLSTDRFMMGRKTFYSEAFDKAGDFNWAGLGLGKIDDIIFSVYQLPINLHSEVLKNYFEFGAIIFGLWLFLILYKNLFSAKAAVILVYFNILILTDNVFVYFEIMFYFYFFILIFLDQRSKQLNFPDK